MKYIIVLGDGMADEIIPSLDNKTPLEFANTPMMDALSKKGEIGMVHTIPEGMAPGSDTANLSVMGYDPLVYYSGRSPLEALSIGVPMKEDDIAFRCNVVTISEEDTEFESQTIIDHSSGEISTEDAAVLIETVKKDGRFRPSTPFTHTVELAKDYIGYGCKMGEGWLLPAEILELADSGVNNIVCTQPFGCLPNHIVGKGMMNPIKQKNQAVNIIAVDYDASASEINQHNRIKLMLANAEK